MLRLARGVRLHREKSQPMLLFPEGIVDLNASAHMILSRLPEHRQVLHDALCRELSHPHLEGFDDFVEHALRQKWIKESLE